MFERLSQISIIFSVNIAFAVFWWIHQFLPCSKQFECIPFFKNAECVNNSHYYTSNSLTLFWLAESVQWIFEISARYVITADYTIIMSRTLKVPGNHVMYDRSAWFPRVIKNQLCATRVACRQWRSRSMTSKFLRSMYNKTIIRFGFCDIQNNQGLEKGYQPQPSASTDNPYLELDYYGYHKNLIQ